MSKTPPNYQHLKTLGHKTATPHDPQQAVLEKVPNPWSNRYYNIRFTAPEFTSLCPITSQPDFAHIVIDYVPNKWIVESKSLKLFLTSFRNHGAFHEDCSNYIAQRLMYLLQPHWLRLGAYWYPRGGMPIDIFWQSSAPPKDVWIPAQDVPNYRGRG